MEAVVAPFPFLIVLSIILAFAVPLAFIAAIVFIVRGVQRRRDDVRLSQDEEIQFRRMMDALGKMETRIANLETILMRQESRPDEKTPS